MRTAFQIKAKMNILREVRFDSWPGEVVAMRSAAVWANDDVNRDDRDDGNNDRSLEQVLLLHYPMRTISFLLCRFPRRPFARSPESIFPRCERESWRP